LSLLDLEASSQGPRSWPCGSKRPAARAVSMNASGRFRTRG